jgi:hypothetical protein
MLTPPALSLRLALLPSRAQPAGAGAALPARGSPGRVALLDPRGPAAKPNSVARVVFALGMPLELIAIEVDVAQIAGAVPQSLIVEVAIARMAALAAR